MATVHSGAAWGGLAAWGAVCGLLHLLLRAWPTDELAAVGGFALAFAALAAVVIVAALDAGQQSVGRFVGGAWAALGVAVLVLARWLDPGPAPLAILNGAALVTLGSWAGAAIGRRVEHARYLWPLVVVALGADLWSVTSPEGVTHQVVVEGARPAVFDYLVMSVPVPGVGVEPVLGVGDVLFSALLAGAVTRHGLSRGRLALGLAVGFLLTLLLLLAVQLPVPALPMLGICGAAALGRAVKPAPRELALAAGMLGLMFGARALVMLT